MTAIIVFTKTRRIIKKVMWLMWLEIGFVGTCTLLPTYIHTYRPKVGLRYCEVDHAPSTETDGTNCISSMASCNAQPSERSSHQSLPTAETPKHPIPFTSGN